ncbi:hypothetical protein [uncultured Eubacterium sp.]|uniref:hypothetical protein n=1 Tax=uncultured Eubacterium sp. TaxID=165185 RepID=UPI0026728BA6|nr:hypothetical protein [uncultured Eubacterium sp.]
MKKIRNLFITVFMLLVLVIGMTISVSADTTTDLSSLKVYAVDAAGKKTEVPMNFSATTYTYNLTVMSNAVKIEIEAVPADSSSKAVVEKEWANTRMDTGKNLTEVSVTSASGAVQKYTLNTTKLTAEEEATYVAPQNDSDKPDDTKTNKNEKDKVIKVGKKEMKISSSFPKSAIPDGFVKSSDKIDGKKYTCIKGEVKELTAFYLYDDETEGFYIYNADKDNFYAMNNIKVKSRMYTIVVPETEDGILKNYDKKKVTIIDTEVRAWVLDEEAGMYLVYAMNWNGDTNLYCYDDNEKCFQRYLVSNDANKQSEAAAKAYDNLEKDYNKLVDKYNFLLKILCGLVIVIIILIFVCINIGLNKKEKRIKKESSDKKDKYISDDDEIEETVDEDIAEEDEEPTEVNLETDNLEEIALDEEKTVGKPRFFGRNKIDRTYGDEPTLGSDLQSDEGFYGGENADEDEIFIDISDDEPEISKKEQIENDTIEAHKEMEEDIKETLKSMLSDENDEDDDFEFIDIDS